MAKKTLTSRRGKKEVTAEEQEKALTKLREDKKRSKFYGRVTIDFAPEMYEEVKEYIKEEGLTMKGYIIKLVRTDLKNK